MTLMSIKDEIRESQDEYKTNLEHFKQNQKKLLIDAKDLMEIKESAVQELEKIEGYGPNISIVEDLLTWEGFETNLHLYQKTIEHAQQQAQDTMTEDDSLDGPASATNGLIASGLVAGAGIAAPTAVVALASTFGVASTGTAIATLSGAAATNATLALIGGGSMATGSAVLGLLGPIGWIGGGIAAILAFGNAYGKNVKKLEEIQKANKELRRALSESKAVREKISDLQSKIKLETVALERIPTDNLKLKMTMALKIARLLNTPVNKDEENESQE